MTDLVPALIAFTVIAAVLVYGYLTDPYRHQATALQPAHGEAHHKRGSLAAEISELGQS